MSGNLLAMLKDASRKLSSSEIDLRVKVETVAAMRDSLDHYVTGPIYTHFLKEMMPCFILILRQPPVFQTSTQDQLLSQKLRNCILEIFHRLPSSLPTPPEPFADYAAEVVDLLMGLVRADNEENAVLCIKILSEIMRHQYKVIGDKVQTFLNLIQEIFDQLEKVVREQLDNTSSSAPTGAPSTPGSTQTSLQQSPRPGSPIVPGAADFGNEPGHHAGRPLIKGMLSFKVLAECPIVVVSLFQVNRTTVIHNVKLFVPLIKSVLCCQAKAQEQAHKDAFARGTIHYGVSPAIKNRTGFNDFIVAQVKTMSFLAYLLRQYSQQLNDFLPTLPSIIVRLLKDCPREKSASRKELIVAIRHIVNFNFRKIFVQQIEELLDERILLGDGLTVSETIRPLAYSTVADLIHHVRDSLSTSQIRKTVEVYTKNLFSELPGTSFQTMTAKLLLNMAECVAKLPNKVDARHHLIMILNAIADKFVAMNKEYSNAVKLSKLYEKQNSENYHDTYLAEKEDSPEWDETDIFQAMPIKIHKLRDRNADPVVDNKFLLKILLNGLKNTFYQLKSCNPQPVVELANPPSHWADVAYGFTAEEVRVIVKLFREGAYVFRYYEIEKPAAEFPYMTTVEYMANFYMTSSSKEEKDLLEAFATVFHCIDPATFHEVFQQEMPRLYEMIHEHTALLHIPQFFLASEATSPSFCGMLMRFLMEHIEDVGSADVRRSAILLRLFKLAFMAVTLFASHNEQVLLPHVVDILTKSIQLSTTAEEPINYFVLLRSLFRSIGGGKFEHLYKHILPLLEMLLDVLNTLLMAARKPWERDLYVELCLTVPARLSNLLPHLSLLMRPLVVALRAGNDLVGQGLRTLELCVDNLTADYLDPIMAPVIDELMAALFDHLRPHPYIHNHAHTTLRILGKLGGRNRKFMTDAPPVDFQPYADDRSSFDVRLIGSKHDRSFPAHLGIDLAISKLMEVPRPGKGPANVTPRQYDPYYKRQALQLIKAQIKLRIGVDNLPDDLPRLVRLQAQDLVARSSTADFSSLERSDRKLSIVKRDEEATLLKRLLKALMFARTIPEFKTEADAFVLNLARHFTIVDVGRALMEMKKNQSPFDVNAGEGPLFVESKVLVDALLESMASDHPDVREGAQRVIKEIYDSAAVIFGSAAKVAHLSLFSNLASAFCHGCYEEDWYTKMGGTLGLRTLLEDTDLGDAWIASKQGDFVKALMYVVKDMPQDLPEKTRRSAQNTLEVLLTRITKNITKEDCLPGVSMPPIRQLRLSSICAHMNLELSHANRHVRDTAKRSLELIATAAGAQVWEILEPHKRSLLMSIYSKPLRALPFAHQIAFIDIVTYYMSLKPDFVAFDDNLNRLLTESLALADANDDHLSGKILEQRVRQSIVNLRVSCIRILSCAMQSEESWKGTVNMTTMKIRIISVFFKCLYMDSKPTIEAAKEAIRRFVAVTTKLPRELLQSSLKPVLTSLQDVKRLNVPTLENLAILLRLLTNYFKVEIGGRLLDQVMAIADQNLLQQLSFTYFEQHGSMKLIVAAFSVYHLLPDGADQFMERLINVALDMEEKLRRTHHSSVRTPLYLFLARYPSEAWATVIKRVDQLKYGRFLAQFLHHPSGAPVRELGSNDVPNLIKTASNVVSQGKDTGHIALVNTVHVLDALSAFPISKGWLDNKEHLDWLKTTGKDFHSSIRANSVPEHLRLAVYQAEEQIVSILIKSLELNLKDFDSLLGLIEMITADELRETPALRAHIYENIICNHSIDFWRTVVLRCLEIYAAKVASQKTKWYLFHFVVNPIMAMDVMRHWNRGDYAKGARLLDKTMIESINTKIWKANLQDPQEDLLQPQIDHTRMEVLQLSAMLVKYHNAILQETRKDFIRFGWTYIRVEDVINKHAAYVVIGYFIAHYETPAKIANQIYFSLLKTNQTEGRHLVTQALELMAPVMPKHCNTLPGDRNAPWAVAPRRILAEESQNAQQMSSIFHFLVRHPALFYESRDKFAMLIITCLRKLAQPLPSVSHENKKLSLNMMLLIWEWERYRVEKTWTDPSRALPVSPSAKRQQRPDDHQQGATSPTLARQQQPGLGPSQQQQPAKAEYQIPVVGRAKMIKYLVEFIAQLHDRYPVPSNPPREQPPGPSLPFWSSDICKKAMRLLYNLLQPQYWGDLDVDLFPNVTDVVLVGEKAVGVLSADKEKYDDRFMTNIVNTLQIVRIILHFKTDEWILKNMSQIQRMLEKPLRSEHPVVQDCLHGADKTCDGGLEIKPMVQRILEAIPEDVPMEDADVEGEAEAPTSELVSFLSALATESMASANYVSGINILWSLGRRQPATIDSQTEALMKSLQSKLARDHVSHYTNLAHQAASARPAQQDQNSASELTPYELEVQTGLIIKAIEILAMRMEILGDRRRQFLSVLATLVEKSLSIPLCEKILDMVEGWALRSEGTWPTLKEKTAVLNKMVAFEHRQDPTLLMKFLDLVIRIYEDPKVARTELTVRMEVAFLIGTRAQDVEMRNRFMSLFDKCLPRAGSSRLAYVILSQNWDMLADTYWLAQASQLLMGGIDTSQALQLNSDDFRTFPPSLLFGTYAKDEREPAAMADDQYESFMANHRRFMAELGDVRVRDILDPLTQLQHTNSKLSHDLWVVMFPLFWTATVREERSELERGLVTLLTKEWHSRQMDKRPNVVQTMLTGAAMVWPDCKVPPHVVKFLAKTYDVWYTALCQLERAAIKPVIDSKLVRESNLDALTDLYATLSEEDLFYGTWRRRCQFVETNAALSFEQNGLWDKAQRMYEAAQIKARTGVIPFSEAEYMLWEDHWMICAQKLQQWEILQEVAKMENFQDLVLECAWRNPEYWQDQDKREQLDTLIKGVMDAPTPRRAFFQSFMYLLKLHYKQESLSEFTRVVDESIQLSIRKWHQLPRRLTAAHVALLQNFQQLVEFHDASIICQSLAATNQGNLDHKSSEVKVLLSSWRDRLPNMWDDIIAWQDLVTWRQHIFSLINDTYLRLLPQTQGQNAGGASYAYRGFHETAWIINRFAHVARKHSLPEVCIAQLSRIYTLPNIEIQEAFLKLREQAKCHYQNPDELAMGLEVINNTNLNYFSATQKAEFYTLKGMFLEKLGQKEDADNAYSSALYHDVTSAKTWAEWGYFNDRRFKENAQDLNAAKQAVTSYLQAASSYKNHKSRKLIARILWLLSLDDAHGTIASGFDDFKADVHIWYWITFIPQLLTGLSHNEAPRLHVILSKIAQHYPQALYFQLRTNREDMMQIKKSHENQNRRRTASQGQSFGNRPTNSALQQGRQDTAKGSDSRPAPSSGDTPTNTQAQGSAQVNKPEIKIEGPDGQSTAGGGRPVTPAPPSAVSTTSASSAAFANLHIRTNQQQAGGAHKMQPWDLTDDIMNILKTGSPLLALTMETLVDQISKHFKCPPDEDAYRLIVALLNDGLAYVSRQPTSYAKDVRLPPATEGNITRFADSILPAHIRGTFEEDFVKAKPTMYEYIHKLRKWRDKFEEKLDRRPTQAPLESFCHYSPPLSEFRHLKFDDVEVPGQYLQLKDKNLDFIRIDRFMPNVDSVRAIGASHRRLKIRGHDGSVHAFAVQHPAARHCRREERTLQLFRQLNQTLASKKESRKRDLQFTLPLMVPLAPHIRMVQEDTTYITLQAVYEDHCRQVGMSKDEPVLFTMEKLRALSENKALKPADHAVTARVEVLKAIQAKFVSQTAVLEYFEFVFPDFAEFWLFRRRFSYQLAAHTFMTYILHIDKRYPHKINIARGSGNIWGSELMPVVSANRPFFHNPEPVPFRLTPTLQTLMGPLATEGIFSCSLMAMARCLTEPDCRLEHALTLYVRDEMMLWFTSNSQHHHNRAATAVAHVQAQAAQAAATAAAAAQANTGKPPQPAQSAPIPAPAPPPPPPPSMLGPHLTEKQLRESVQANSDLIVKKAVSLAHAPQGNLPANQTVIDLIARAVNPMHLAMCDVLWMPYL